MATVIDYILVQLDTQVMQYALTWSIRARRTKSVLNQVGHPIALVSKVTGLWVACLLSDEKVNAHLPYYSTLKGSGMVSSKRFELMLFFSGGTTEEEH